MQSYFFEGLDGETLSLKVKVDEIVEYLLEMKNKMAEMPMMSDDSVCLYQKACGIDIITHGLQVDF